jgi:rhodanese-related sulfurtransferase
MRTPMGLVRHSVALAFTGAVLGLLLNALRGDGVALSRPFAPETEGSAECSAAAGPEEIDVAAAEELLAAHEAVFGDVRSAAEYAGGHVVDAVHLPCSADAPEWLANVAKYSTVILYGEKDTDADQVAQSLSAGGYRDVRVLRGGFASWRDGGGSAASGPCEVCD